METKYDRLLTSGDEGGGGGGFCLLMSSYVRKIIPSVKMDDQGFIRTDIRTQDGWNG